MYPGTVLRILNVELKLPGTMRVGPAVDIVTVSIPGDQVVNHQSGHQSSLAWFFLLIQSFIVLFCF